MPEEKFARYDSADYLKTEEDVAAYLEAVMEEGGDDPAYVARALGVVARARNMTALAREVGMSRVGLNKCGPSVVQNFRRCRGKATRRFPR